MSYQRTISDAINELMQKRAAIVKGLYDAGAALDSTDKRKRALVEGLRDDIARMENALSDTTEAIHDLDRLDVIAPEIEEIHMQISELVKKKRKIYDDSRISEVLADSGLRSGILFSPVSASNRIGFD